MFIKQPHWQLVVVPLLVTQIAFGLLIGHYSPEPDHLQIQINFITSGLLLVLSARVLELINRHLAVVFLIISILVLIAANAVLLGLLVFSGQGFSPEFFYHLEPTSFSIAFEEYGWQIIAGISVTTVALAAITRAFYAKSSPLPLLKRELITFFAVVAVFFSVYSAAPLGQLWAQWWAYYAYDNNAVYSDEDYDHLLEAGVLESLSVLSVSDIEVRPSPNPKNLILIYLESFNSWLTDLTEYPGLTPNLRALEQRFKSTSQHFNSSYVTIEGVISSQCGTMLPMLKGNDSMVQPGAAMAEMACLGDILAAAGYQNTYMGGARGTFAGKGAFFEDHGYQQVLGWEHWLDLGYRPETGVWGLSDKALLDRAFELIDQREAPYNVTLLTLGTHIPGFLYQGCTPYDENDHPFLNAVHCTDQLIGGFVARLEQAGHLENTVVWIMGDHGVFPNAEMRSLFGDRVKDRRILTIVINGDELAPNWSMSTYDLVPTLLDLLSIEHNQEFLFGRSALDQSAGRFYVTRYTDWVAGVPRSPRNGSCDQPINGSVKSLTSCQKRELLQQTQAFLDRYRGRPEMMLSCLAREPLSIIESNPSGWRLFLASEDKTGLVSRKGRPVSELNEGAVLIGLDSYHHITSANFHESSEQGQNRLVRELRDWQLGIDMMLLWLGDWQADDNLQTHLAELGMKSLPGAGIFALHPERSSEAAFIPFVELPFVLTSDQCRSIFTSRDI